MGALTDRSFAEVQLAVPFIAIGCVLLLFTGRALDALTLGEDAARSLGVRLQRTQMLIVLGAGLAVGASVAVTGVVGFVGLIVPHLLRPLTGAQALGAAAAERAGRRRAGRSPPTVSCGWARAPRRSGSAWRWRCSARPSSSCSS